MSRLLAALLAGLWLSVSAVAVSQSAVSPDEAGAGRQPSLRVLTWNVLARSAGERLSGWLGGGGSAERARALLQAARRLHPDIVAFQ